jgi:hypothetical protein
LRFWDKLPGYPLERDFKGLESRSSGRFLGQETVHGSPANLKGYCDLPDRGSGLMHLLRSAPIKDDTFPA